ncbi:MAG TPA: hypothetical protein VJ600_11365 [Holophagaceae bacterium]|nr:hypothetical protein [Holophagaceae bacterium]
MLDLLALKHPMLVHLPLAAALLLPLPLLLSQRAGRGIRPWWTASRYLGWMGLLGLLPALVSGFLWARGLGLIPHGHLLAPPAAPGTLGWLMRRHQLFALATLPLAVLTVLSLHRRRHDYEGIGKTALVLGLLWAAAAVQAGRFGGRMAHPPAPFAPADTAKAAPAPPPDPEADVPVRFLDFASLQPVQRAFVRGSAHGMKWERAWLTASAADAFAQGRPLPPGAYAVLSTTEDAFGRPGQDPGPLYAYEILDDGKPAFTVYWGRVPEARKAEFGGEDSVYWRKDAPALKGCLQCHAGGASAPAQRTLEPPRPRRLVAE